MQNKVLEFDKNLSNIKRIFNDTILKESFNTATANLSEMKGMVLRDEIDAFFNDSFFEEYFKSLIASIDYSCCRETEWNGSNCIIYGFIMTPPMKNLDKYTMYELDIALEYLHSIIHNEKHVAFINKILAKYDMESISHSVNFHMDALQFSILVDVVLTDGDHKEFLSKFKKDILNNRSDSDEVQTSEDPEDNID